MKIQVNSLLVACFFSLCLVCISCNQSPIEIQETTVLHQQQNEAAFTGLLQKHLQSVSDRDLKALEGTLDPQGQMQLILEGEEIMATNKAFMDFHKGWFADTSWTFETKILNSRVGNNIGFAIVEAIYREPERDGVPYFNRQIISYDLQKNGGEWYVVKDHCTSVQKSTD